MDALDRSLQQKVKKNKEKFHTKQLEDHELLCINGKIVVPKVLQPKIINWIHTYLVHPGATRMEMTIGSLFAWDKMREDI